MPCQYYWHPSSLCRQIAIWLSNPQPPRTLFPIPSRERNSPMEVIINIVLSHMQPLLDALQLKQLKATMRAAFERTKTPSVQDPADLLKLLLTAKEIEGCSPRTIAYYRTTLAHMTQALAKPYTQVTSDDLRAYLVEYEQERAAGKVTIGNIRRIMSSCQMLEYI